MVRVGPSAANRTELVNNYGLFKDGRLRQIRQAEPGEALQLLGSVAVDLVEYTCT